MILLLDCDGVFCDFARMVTRRLHMPEHTVTKWDFTCTGKNPYQIREATSYTQDNCHRLGTYPGALSQIERLRKRARVVCVTATLRTERLWWLETYCGFKRRDVILAEDKSLVHGDIFVDDKPSNVQEWEQEHPFGRAVLFSRPYNDHASPELERIRCLSELLP